MDQDSMKDGVGDGNRRNWRERLGVGQDLPKISDEFSSVEGDAGPADGDPRPEPQTGPRPGTPVSRPAPMAPRYARPAAQQAGNGSSTGPDMQGSKPVAVSPGQKPWAASTRPAPRPGEPGRPASSHAPSPAPGSDRPGHAPRANPAPGPQRPAPTRGPAAYAQAEARPGGASPASGHDSFGERLRAQREAAERLAQQRLAAARERSSQVRTDPLTILTPRKQDTMPQGKAEPRAEPPAHTKPAGTEQPRFTFAEVEIVAAQQETSFSPAAPPAPAGPDKAKPAAMPDPRPAPEDVVNAAPEPRHEPRAEYRHEDDGMFEDEQPELQASPAARASAADYSAAYREFEDEFEEDEPRRGSGPLLLLLSLAALAVVSGGLIYWYQQLEGAPAPEAREVPVISAPQEPVKAEPEPPPEQPLQQAAQPTTRKQIYDRIIGEETLEPERIVPTEEVPQLQQIQQRQQPRDAGEGQSETPGTARQEESDELQPLPVPPPPGTGEQGDLLVPGMADTETASASPEPAELSLPAPAERSASAPAPAEMPGVEQAAVVPAAGDPPSRATTAAPELRDTTDAEVPASASIYPELTEPLAYPTIVESPPQDQPADSDEAGIAEASEPASQVDAALAEAVAEAEAEVAEVEPQVPEAVVEPEPVAARASDVPLPKAKPESPVRTAAAQAPQAQPEAQPQPSGSGPVQILPSNIASGQAPAQSRAVQQPDTQPATRRRTVGRDFDPLAGQRSIFSASPAVEPVEAVDQPAPSQQVASVEPDTATSQPGALGGYVVQLASFRSEGEARNDHQRLVQRHPQLVSGLESHIREASLGESGSFYRLSLGPMADRNAATKLCTDLIAAGEKDCLVRRR